MTQRMYTMHRLYIPVGRKTVVSLFPVEQISLANSINQTDAASYTHAWLSEEAPMGVAIEGDHDQGMLACASQKSRTTTTAVY